MMQIDVESRLLPEADGVLCEHLSNWEQTFGPNTRKFYIEERYIQWMTRVEMPYLLSIVPKEWTRSQLAECFSISPGNISKYERGIQLPSPAVAMYWRECFSSEPVEPDPGICTAFAVGSAIRLVRHERLHCRRSPREKLGIPDVPLNAEDTALQFAMIVPQNHRIWIDHAVQYQDNLLRALVESSFTGLLADIVHYAVTLFGRPNPLPNFVEAAERLAEIDLSDRLEATALVQRLVHLWEPVQLDAYCVIQCLDQEIFPQRYSYPVA